MLPSAIPALPCLPCRAPNLTCLTSQNLDTTLKETTIGDIAAWALSHPCQTRPFADAVLTGLEFCPYALGVLEVVAKVAEIRDEMLRIKPAMLDGLLRNAMADENNFEKVPALKFSGTLRLTQASQYSPACLSLLSTPLPTSFPPPALLAPFFLRTVTLAATNTTPTTLRNVHTLVSTGFSHLSSLLTPSQSRTFSDQMAQFLSAQGKEDTNTLLVLSLSTLAHMALALDANTDESSPRNKEKGPLSFFRGKKAQRVLPLVTNIVIDLVARNPENWEETTELIEMASVVVQAVTKDVKEAWTNGKEAAVLGRLLDKLERKEMRGSVKMAVLKFVGVLCEGRLVPRLRECFARLVVSGRKEVGGEFLPPELAQLMSDAPREVVETLLEECLRFASVEVTPTIQNAAALRDRILLLSYLITKLPNSTNLRTHISTYLSSSTSTALLKTFIISLAPTSTTHSCLTSEACPTALLISHRKFKHLLSTLLLHTLLHTPSASVDATLSTSLLAALSTLLSAPVPTCPFTSPPPQASPLPLLEASATPHTSSRITSTGWRSQLQTILIRSRERDEQTIISALGEICRDLETRCETVEQPLLEARERGEAWRKELEEYRSQCADLEREDEERRGQMEELERGKQVLQKRLGVVMEKAEEHHSKVKELEGLVEEVRKEFAESVVGASRRQEEMEKEHAEAVDKLKTEFTVYQKDAEGQAAEKRREWEELIRHLREQADVAATENLQILNDRQDRIEELEEQIKTMEEKLASFQELLNEAESQITAAATEKDNLEAEIQDAGAQYSKLRRETGEKIDTLQTSVANLENERDSLKADLTSETNLLTEAHQKITSLDSTLRDLQNRNKDLESQLVQFTTERDRLQHLFDEVLGSKRSAEEAYNLEVKNLQDEAEEQIHQLRLEHHAMVTRLNADVAKLRKELKEETKAKKKLGSKWEKEKKQQEEKERKSKLLTTQLLAVMGGGGGIDGLAGLLGGQVGPHPTAAAAVVEGVESSSSSEDDDDDEVDAEHRGEESLEIPPPKPHHHHNYQSQHCPTSPPPALKPHLQPANQNHPVSASAIQRTSKRRSRATLAAPSHAEAGKEFYLESPVKGQRTPKRSRKTFAGRIHGGSEFVNPPYVPPGRGRPTLGAIGGTGKKWLSPQHSPSDGGGGPDEGGNGDPAFLANLQNLAQGSQDRKREMRVGDSFEESQGRREEVAWDDDEGRGDGGDETNYGTAVVLSSTPKGGLLGLGREEISRGVEEKEEEGEEGEERDGETTIGMEF